MQRKMNLVTVTLDMVDQHQIIIRFRRIEDVERILCGLSLSDMFD